MGLRRNGCRGPAPRGGGADLILDTCSSVGDVVPGARALFGVPIVRIDDHDRLLVEAALQRDVVAMIRRAGGPRPA